MNNKPPPPGAVDINQLKKYAEDLAELYKSEKQKSEELEAANKKLVQYSDDLKKTISKLKSLRREFEEVRSRLRRAERLRLVGEIAAQVAHEIKNPLGPIKGYSKLLLEDLERGSLNTKDAKENLGVIVEEAERIDERISRLLGFAREDDSLRTPIDPNAACRRAVMLLEAGDDLKPECRVDLDLCAENIELLVDSFAIEEAVYNLLLNAAQAVDNGGKISLKTALDRFDQRQWFVIEIADDGPGFSSANPEELFKPFYTTRSEGTGLGLGIVRTIVKSHGGSVVGASPQEGGAVFTIRLPIS